ncbi:hypothetical protein ACPV5S_15655 [Vibrio astriarenae]
MAWHALGGGIELVQPAMSAVCKWRYQDGWEQEISVPLLGTQYGGFYFEITESQFPYDISQVEYSIHANLGGEMQPVLMGRIYLGARD